MPQTDNENSIVCAFAVHERSFICEQAPKLPSSGTPHHKLKFLPVSADCIHVTPDDLIELELMLNRFRRLVADLIRGSLRRNSFESWEIDLLLDFETCPLNPRKRLQILRAYQKAVEHQLESGPGPPMKLSEFLQLKITRRPTTS
jgi:hypothetical protein